MNKLSLVSALAGAMLFSTAALAAEFDNMCAMGLALGKDVHTDCTISGEIGGKTYCFGNADAKTQFMKDPEGNLAEAQAYYDKSH
jgi:YHS domain-containing protein